MTSEPKTGDETKHHIRAQLHPKFTLTPQQKRTYSLEQYSNSRGLFRLLAVKSKHILTASDIAPPELVSSISRIGAFAEAANGGTSVDPRWVWKNLNVLLQKGAPLEGYEGLAGSELLDSFRGDVAELQTVVCRREEGGVREVVVSFSGTERFSQVLCDADIRLVKFPLPEGIQEVVAATSTMPEEGEAACPKDYKKRSRVKAHVHAGFYRMLIGLLKPLSDTLTKALDDSTETPALTLTGHSLGGALSLLLAIHILAYALPSGSESKREEPARASAPPIVHVPHGTRIRVVVFGAPRVGDAGLVKVYRALVEAYRARFGPDAFREHSVKAYGDGIHCIPPRFMGFRHLCANSLYLVHDHLFQVHSSDSDCSVFPVSLPDASSSGEAKSEGDAAEAPSLRGPLYPRGGHNYYNGRDMERTLRRLRWLDVDRVGEDGWLERYQNGQRTEDISIPFFSFCCFRFYKTNHEM